MLRTIFVVTIIVVGAGYALKGPFFALLFYLWIAYFRPETWVWYDFVSGLNLSFITGVYLLGVSVLTGQRFFLNLRSGLLFAFLVLCLGSALMSRYFDYAFHYWTELTKAVVISYLIPVLATDVAKFRLVLLAIGVSLGFEGAKQGWAQFIRHPGGLNANEIPFLGDNNGVAVGMLMLAPLLLALAQTADWKWERRGFQFVGTGVIYRAITTYSRGAFLACGALAALHVVRSRHRIRTILAAVAVAGLLFSVLPEEFWDRMDSIRAEDEERDDSAASRLHFWAVATHMAAAEPLGVGVNSFPLAYDRYDFLDGRFGVRRAVHSTWFGTLAELGYLGLMLFLIMLMLAFLTCWRVRRLPGTGAECDSLRKFAKGLEASFVVFVVGGTFVHLQYLEMYWHYLGLAIALGRLAESQASVAVDPVAQTTAVGASRPATGRSAPAVAARAAAPAARPASRGGGEASRRAARVAGAGRGAAKAGVRGSPYARSAGPLLVSVRADELEAGPRRR